MQGKIRHMKTTVDAVYADGILRPLTALNLPENSTVRLVVETADEKGSDEPDAERMQWMQQSERSLMKVWNNPEDDVYNALLSK
jgi:predicted DNA-binding antitoxin AbrB/MazE fold protein